MTPFPDEGFSYIARFKLNLLVPIMTNEGLPLELQFKPQHHYLKQLRIRACPKNSLISDLSIEAEYVHSSLGHAVIAGKPLEDGVAVFCDSGRLLPTWEIPLFFVGPILYQIAGLTLQADAYSKIDENLSTSIADFHWILPGGNCAPSIPFEYPIKVFRNLGDSGRRALTADDWKEVQLFLDRKTLGAPLWRLILAEAHRDRTDDLRNVVIHCATALDIAVQPFLPAGEKFNMELLRGECKWAKTPDLRKTDSSLYQTLARLWYSRHGIVHRGEINLYDENPVKKSVKPLRVLSSRDTEEFLVAVPRGVAYVEANRP